MIDFEVLPDIDNLSTLEMTIRSFLGATALAVVSYTVMGWARRRGIRKHKGDRKTDR